MKVSNSERGAAAVEFALVVPLLVAMIWVIVLMGAAYNTQITLTEIARAGVRSMVIDSDQGAAREAAMLNVAGLTGFSKSDINFSPGTCTPGDTMTATATYPVSVPFLPAGSKFLGQKMMDIRGTASMRCGG